MEKQPSGKVEYKPECLPERAQQIRSKMVEKDGQGENYLFDDMLRTITNLHSRTIAKKTDTTYWQWRDSQPKDDTAAN